MMKIESIEWKTIGCGLKKPFKTALRTLDYLEVVQVIVRSDTGEYGIGGCAPTAAITGETMGSINGALEIISARLKGVEIAGLEYPLEVLNASLVGNTSAKAAVDIALHALFSRSLGIPLYRYLGGGRDRLTTDLTISLNPAEEMAADAAEAAERGFGELKLKVGGHPDEDIDRILKVREALGPDVSLRLDANQGWSPRDAVRVVNTAMARGASLDFLEQPVAGGDLKGMRWVRERIDIPVVADESVFGPEDALRIIENEAADGLNIKLMKCGGINRARKILALAETAGLFCMVGAMMESHAGITAAAHLGASSSIVKYADLDVPLLCSEKTEKGGVMYDGPKMRFPDSPGLGMELPG